MNPNILNRRSFMKLSGATIAGLAIPNFLRAQTCNLETTTDRYGLGPYYLEGAPNRLQLAAIDEPGAPIEISGIVSDCNGPIAGVQIEVWHATDAGCYIHPAQPNCNDGGSPLVRRLWGTLTTSGYGYYSFKTIKPGVYLNGATYRPSHIHLQIKSPVGAARSFKLVTQLYFEGDPFIAGDYAASDPTAANRIIKLTPNADRSLATGVFDIGLPVSTTGILHSQSIDRKVGKTGFDILMHTEGNNLIFEIPSAPPSTNILLQISKMNGSVIYRSHQYVRPLVVDKTMFVEKNLIAEFSWTTPSGIRKESMAI